jgi:periplasmic mercuric ion binding protein
MIRILAASSIATIALASAAASASAAERTVILAVANMYCEACPYIVKQSLARIPGVEQVVVSFEHKTAKVIYDDQKTGPDAFISVTTQAGYPSQVAP